MINSRKQIESTVILLLLLQTVSPKPTKTNARPVHEIVNEQSRIDESRNPGTLPYGNPLAGNLQQNIRLHAQNQQAMFNAERVRQHRAQLQRWTKQPQQIDSYMKAYQESQENHQLALEQQQAKTQSTKRVNNKQEKRAKLQQGPDPVAKADHKERSRSHRSYGSVQNQQYVIPKRHQTVYISQADAYEGVTIKPNGNVGIKQLNAEEETNKLYTEIFPSKTQYIYPKQYNQMQSYESAQDIKALNSLLTKTPRDQLLELNALIQSEKQTTGEKDPLETPIDLFFYAKDQPTIAEYKEENYGQVPQNYASAYFSNTGMKYHTPITEEVDDIEAPYTNSLQVLPTHTPEDETTTTKRNNYYKVEVASQIISGHKPRVSPEYYEKDVYETIKYEPAYYVQEPKESKEYYQHNQQGVQHLTSDGLGVSAYGDDNVSNKDLDNKNRNSIRIRRSLDTDPFLLPNDTEIDLDVSESKNTTESLVEIDFTESNSTDPTSEELRRRPFYEISRPFLPPIPNDDSYYFYSEDDNRKEYDEDYNGDDDFTIPDFEYGAPNNKQSSLFSLNKNKRLNYLYRKKNHRQNADSDKSSSDTFSSYSTPIYGPPISTETNDFTASYGNTRYGEPNNNPNAISKRYISPLESLQNLEPVYMLTETQLKALVNHGHGLNIEHLDIFQLPKERKRHLPRKYRRRHQGPKNLRKNLYKLQKLLM